MTTSGTARRHCSPPSTCSTAGSSAMARHRHQEFIRFLNKINRETPGGRELHLIVDNYATHKHPRVRAWLERHKRFHFHFTPTSASWLNAVEDSSPNSPDSGSSAACSRASSISRPPSAASSPKPIKTPN